MRSISDTRWRIRKKPVILLFVALLVVTMTIYTGKDYIKLFIQAKATEVIPPKSMHLVVVSCGRPNYLGVKDFSKPLDLSLTMIKSAAMFAKSRLHLHIFTEDEIKMKFRKEIESWPEIVQNRVKYTIYSADYSNLLPQELTEEWKKWYKPCGSFRLFLPMILKDVTDAAIYSDSDVIFVKPIDELWNYFKLMDERHVAAISPTSGHPLEGHRSNINFISNQKGLFQINSGIMLLNFTRILHSDWKMFHDVEATEVATAKYGVDLLLPYYKKYKDQAEHDQKLLNIMFHFNPEFLYQLPCSWNFKNNFCINDKNTCPVAEEGGAGAVHGISGSFFGDSNPTFKGLYESFKKYKMGDDLQKKLNRPFLSYIGARASNTYCAKKSFIITNSLHKSIDEVDFIVKEKKEEQNR